MSKIIVKTCLICDEKFVAIESDYCSRECFLVADDKEKRAKLLKRKRAKELHKQRKAKSQFQHPVHRVLTTDCRAYSNKPEPEKWKVYQDYLMSATWLRIRNRTLARYKFICGIPTCPEKAVFAHHKRYRSWGAEKEEDLIAVCKRHHDKLHGREIRG